MMEKTGDPDDAVFRAAVEHLARIRGYLRGLAEEAGVVDPSTFARQWHVLMKGSIMAAHEGDTGAATAARELGVLLLRANGLSPGPETGC